MTERWTLSSLGPALGQWALPFLLVVYLGLRGGGYDPVVRSEVGIAVWWIVALATLVGTLPAARFSRAAWVALGFGTAFTAWTALGISWSESAGASVAELGRVAALIAILWISISVQGRDGLRRAIGALAAGIAFVALFALLSRLHPSWFPKPEVQTLLPGAQARLNYPVNYWNGLAAMVAIGIPLLLTVGVTARSTVARAASLAIVPALALTLFFTLSRGGGIELALALVALVALSPARGRLIAYGAAPAIGSFILIVAANQRGALGDGLRNATAGSQGNEVLALAVIVCLGVALLTVAATLADRFEVGPRLAVTSRQRRFATGVVVVAALLIFLVAGGPSKLSNSWDEFKNPAVPHANSGRFDSASGSGRYQYWKAAVDATKSEPIAGIGPGTYEYWWARTGTIPGFVRNAHSLFLQTAAEVGLVGLLLIIGLIFTPFVAGIRRWRQASSEGKVLLAGAVASCVAFIAAAAIDWVWQLTVIPVAFLILAGAILGMRSEPETETDEASEKAPKLERARFLVIPIAVAGIIAIAIPMAGAKEVDSSQAQVRADNLDGALSDAKDARALQPYAAAPTLQESLVLELRGELPAATELARKATVDEPTNWRNWLVLSRLEAKQGNAEGSVDAYRHAKSLNPNSSLFR